MAVIDAHAHLWDRTRFHYAWLDAEPDLPGTFLPSDLHEAAPEIDAFVFVQADCADDQGYDEAAWVRSLPAGSPALAGIVAFAPLERDDADTALTALEAIDGVVGVRRLLQSEHESFFEHRGLSDGLRGVVRRGWTFDACVRAHQLPALTSLVREHPDLTVVVDHLGKPEITSDAEAFERWRADLGALARLANTVVKLSGLPAESRGREPAPDVAPWLRAAVDLFGPQRSMLGSDWPVSGTGATRLPEWIAQVRAAVGASTADWHEITEGTVKRTYGITLS